MSFRKRRLNNEKLEKIEEIIDEKIIDEKIIDEKIIDEKIIEKKTYTDTFSVLKLQKEIESLKKDKELKDLLISNLKKLNSTLLLKISNNEKERKKINREKTNIKLKNEKLKNELIEFENKKQEELKEINLQHQQNICNLNEDEKKEKEIIYQKHDKKIIKINEQHEKYKERYRKEIKMINLQNNQYNETMKNQEKEKYEKKMKKKEESLQEMYNLKTKKEIEIIIKERKKRHMEIINTIKITQNVQNSVCEQIKNCQKNLIDGKFNDSRFKTICLCKYDTDSTNKILIENELNNIFPNIEYVPYFEFHSEYVTRIITVLKSLEIFLDDPQKFLILFEYDFQWLFNKDFILEKLNSIKNNKFNLILLNYNNFHITYKNDDKDHEKDKDYIKNFIGIKKNANNINSFIISKSYAKKLIKILEDVIKKIVQNNNKSKKLYEKSFNKLLKDKRCYGIIPSLGKQRLIYNTEQNINCIIAILDNNTEILYNEIPYIYKIIKKTTYNFAHENNIYLNEEEDISSEIIKYCYNEFPKLDYLFVFKNGYKYTKQQMKLIFKKVIETQSNLILNKNNEDFFIKLKKENLDLNNLINNKDFKIIDFNLS